MSDAAENAVDVVAVAEMLKLSTDTIYRKAKSGDIPGFKIGGRWRFFPSVVRHKLTEERDPWAYSPQSRAARRRLA